jgi:4-carboxymuconolactone decarboxylase
MKKFWLVAVLLFTAGAQAQQLPKDVHPDSLNRLPLIKRDQLTDPAALKLFDSYAGPNSKSLAGLQGPGGIRLWSPHLAALNEPRNTYIRYNLDLSRRLTELAILVTAREFDSQFEWAAHEPAAIKEGLEPQIVDIVKNRKDLKGLKEDETVIISIGRELFGKRNLTSETYARGIKLLGEKGMVDLISLMTDYVSTSYFLRAFDMQLHAGQKPLLPMP